MARTDTLGHFLTDVADAIRTKTGSSSSITASSFDTEIQNIPSGPTPEPEEKDVCLYDYDGTRLYSYTKTEFQALEALPSLPTHEGLVAQEWNYTLANAKTYLNTYDKLDIGATYDTTHHGINIYLKANKYILNNLTITTTTQAGATINWGDGTTSNVTSGTDIVTTHNYSQAGYYKISITPNGTYGVLLTLKQNFVDNEHKMRVDKVEVGECVDISAQKTFYDFDAMETLTIAKRYGNASAFTSNSTACFQYCRSLKAIVIPRGGYTFGTYMFSDCNGLRRFIYADTYNDSYGKITEYCFKNDPVIENITYPEVGSFESNCINCSYAQTKIVVSKNARIKASAFSTSRYVKVFDFSKNTKVSTLDNYNAFNDIASYKIVVPDSLYSTWRSTSPWNNSSIVNNIVRVSDFNL